MRFRVPALALLVIFGGSVAGHADTLDYTLTTLYSGTIGSTAFTDATLTITGSADTADIHIGSSNNISNVVAPMTLSISGVGSFIFSDTMEFGTSLNAVGINDDTGGAHIVIRDASVLGYNINQTGSLTGLEGATLDGTFGTSGGVLSLTGAPAQQTGSFVAVSAVPESSELVLTASGALALLGTLRRRTRLGKIF